MRPAALLLTTLFLVGAAPCPVADAPPAVPDLPALVVGSRQPPRSFVIEGVLRPVPGVALGIRIATDGDKQVCAIYDWSDGTPLMFSDGFQTLIYDLPNGRVVRMPNSRAYVRVDWKAADPRPMSF